MDQSMTVKINVDNSGALPAGNEVVELFRKMEAELKAIREQGEASGKTLGEGHAKSAAAAKEHAGAIGGLAEGMHNLDSHVRVAAMGFDALGVEAGAAAVKISALSEVLESVVAAAPELLAIGAAVIAASVAFNVFRESVDEAARSQREMVTITALVRNQGGEAWREQAKSIEEYAVSLTKTSVFQKGEYLQGMQTMLAAGVSVNDVLRSQQAAMDLAVATGHALSETENGLANAYNGRFRELERLGIITRDEVKNGLDYETILQRIEQRMGGSASAALNTYSGQWQNFQNLVGEVRDRIGTALLPIFTTLAEEFRHGAGALDKYVDGFVKWIQAVAPDAEQAIRNFGEAAGKVADDILPKFEHGLESIGDTFVTFASNIGTAVRNIQDLINKVKEWYGIASQHASLGYDPSKASTNFLLNPAGAAGDMIVNGITKDLGSLPPSTGSWMERNAGLTADQIRVIHQSGPSAAASLTYDQNLALAIQQASSKYGFDPALLAAIAQQESGAGHSSLYDAATGRSRTSGNLGRGPFQLDPASGASASQLDLVSHDVYAAADTAGRMIADALHRAGGNVAAALSIYNSGGLTTAGASYASQVLARVPQGATLATPLAQVGDSSTPSHIGRWTPPTTPSHHHIAGTSTQAGVGYTIDLPPDVFSDPTQNSQNALNDYLKSLTSDELAYKTAVELATTSQEKEAAQRRLTTEEVKNANLALDALREQMRNEADETAHLNGERKNLTTQINENLAAQKGLAAAIDAANARGDHDGAQALATKLSGLRQEYSTLTTHATAVDSALDKLRAQFAANTVEVAKYNNVIAQSSKEHAKLLLAYNDAVEKMRDEAKEFLDPRDEEQYWSERIAALGFGSAEYLKHFADFDAKREAAHNKAGHENAADETARRRAEDEIVMYKMSEDALTNLLMQRAYLERRKATESREEQRATQNEIEKIDVEIYKQRKDHHDKFVDDMRAKEASYLDDILAKHKSFGDTVKHVWDDIRNAYIQNLEQMIVKSSVFANLNQSLFGVFGGGNAQGGIVGVSGAQVPFGLGNILGGAANRPDGTQGNPVSVKVVDGIGSDPNNPQHANIAQIAGVNVPGGGDFQSALNSLAIGPMLAQGAMTGLGIGALTSGMTGGNSTWGSVGGALGGAAGMYFGGPLGSQIGSAIGGAIGGMFGPHWGPASNYPDRGPNQSTYGQFEADWQGSNNNIANGVAYNASSQYNATMGGTPLWKQMEQWANAFAGNTSSLTQQQRGLVAQILGLEHGNANADLGVTGLHNGVWTLASGAQISYTDAQNLAQAFQSSGAANNPAAPSYTFQRLYPDLNQGKLVDASGNVVTQPSTASAAPQVNVTIQGSVYGPGGLAEVADTVATAIQQRQHGVLPGSGRAMISGLLG